MLLATESAEKGLLRQDSLTYVGAAIGAREAEESHLEIESEKPEPRQ